MRKLLELANIQKPGTDKYTARLAITSLVALFQDILPSYRIRLPTAAELAVRVTKETKKLWDYERNLLQHYQQFLKILERTWDGCTAEAEHKALAVTAMLALCELLKSASHFNFCSNILQLVVKQMNHKQPEVSEACCAALEHVFRNDVQGEVALEATRLVAKLVKDRKFRVQSRVLQTFVALPLRVHVDEAQAAKLATQANKKKRRGAKQEAEIESELQEGSGSVDKIRLARSQADALQAVTVTYFHILKNPDLSTKHIAELLPTALEGLAKFAHLINIDTVMDLLQVLKTMLQRVDDLPLDASLNCILTAFQTLQGPGRELKIDQKEYITPLYTQLPRLCLHTNKTQHCTKLALECLDAAFLKRREYSSVRVASFTKELLTIALHCPPYTATPLLAMVRQLYHRYPSLHQLLENEQDIIMSGQYDPLVLDPELANPFATCAWEVATLAFHMHDKVATQASRAASLKLIQLPAEAPERLRGELVHSADDLIIEAMRIQRKHPLGQKAGQSKKQEARFISPNPTPRLHLMG
jgi:nucleolar complex protein 3